MNSTSLLHVPTVLDDQELNLAIAAYLARFKGQTRAHTASDLKSYLAGCRSHDLPPISAQRAHVELYLRWMQEVKAYKPSTVSRRLSILSGFYRTCVIDGVVATSPVEHVRRPYVPSESTTLGLSHLQFEALLTGGRDSSNINDFALVCMLGLLGCASSRPPAPTSETSTRYTGTEFFACKARATRSLSRRCHRR